MDYAIDCYSISESDLDEFGEFGIPSDDGQFLTINEQWNRSQNVSSTNTMMAFYLVCIDGDQRTPCTEIPNNWEQILKDSKDETNSGDIYADVTITNEE
jgi:hypothetical protein